MKIRKESQKIQSPEMQDQKVKIQKIQEMTPQFRWTLFAKFNRSKVRARSIENQSNYDEYSLDVFVHTQSIDRLSSID